MVLGNKQLIDEIAVLKLNNKISTTGLHEPEQLASMKPSKLIIPLPNNCIEKVCKGTEPQDGYVKHHVFEKSTGYSYRSSGINKYFGIAASFKILL